MPEYDYTEMSLIKNGNGYFSDVEKYFRCAWSLEHIDKIEFE